MVHQNVDLKSDCVESLKELVQKNGKVLGNGILKVDSFVNHQIYPSVMMKAGRFIGDFFKDNGVTRILTVESSGIAPAFATSVVMDVPLVFARKKKPVTMAETIKETAPSHTKGGIVELHISSEFLNSDDRVIIVDDFLASGNTLDAMVRIVERAGAKTLGIATVIEKTFENGRDFLSNKYDFPILGLLRISSLDNDNIKIEDW